MKYVKKILKYLDITYLEDTLMFFGFPIKSGTLALLLGDVFGVKFDS